MSAISEIAVLLRNGKSIRQSAELNGLPITRIETIADGTINPAKVGFADLEKSDCTNWLLQDGDILISHINSTKHLGKCAIYEGDPPALIHGMNLLVLRVDPYVAASRYIFWVLSSTDFRRKLPRITKHSVNQSSFNISSFRKLEIPLPPLAEQKRIAGILDAADALRTKRRETLDQLDVIIQSTFLDMFGDPAINPMGWKWDTLGEVIRVRSGDGLVSMEMAPDGKYPVYGGNGISGHHDSFMFAEPTIVLGRVGVNCGAVHLTRPRAWVTDNALYVHTFIQPINKIYLVAALKMANLNQYASQSAQPLISGNRIYPIKIPIPPVDLQHRFATVVESVEQQKASQQAHLTQLDTLFASLQSRAFRGNL